eukprot:TRINITY_DN7441_c0_g1_i3.p1 TRINITY_DN7441_c0_g1~~TRINITY_DN7441_c0_g1_i3.p1  ORF type:complete len:302 (+),score=39.03 TRINITY_DN7441_c0_g1_i3:161-1066(+)
MLTSISGSPFSVQTIPAALKVVMSSTASRTVIGIPQWRECYSLKSSLRNLPSSLRCSPPFQGARSQSRQSQHLKRHCLPRSCTPPGIGASLLHHSDSEGARRGRRSVSCQAEGTSGAVIAEENPKVEDDSTLVEGLDIRVGRIIKAWKHPEADSLYVEEVDVGEAEGPRTICSGLVKYVPEDELQGKLVLVLANLKPRNMRGVKSNGMLLCASDAAHENVELLNPPEGAAPGERVWFGGEGDGALQAAAASPNQLTKKKIWEGVQPQLKTTGDLVATYKGRPMRVASGVVTSKSLGDASIS